MIFALLLPHRLRPGKHRERQFIVSDTFHQFSLSFKHSTTAGQLGGFHTSDLRRRIMNASSFSGEYLHAAQHSDSSIVPSACRGSPLTERLTH